MPLEFNERIAHAEKGYARAQDVIKFIDTKSAAVTGLSVLILGFAFAIGKWVLEIDPAKQAVAAQFIQRHQNIVTCVAYGLGFSGLLGTASVICCTHSTMGRNPRRAYQGIIELAQKCWRRVFKRPLVKGSEAVMILFPIHQEHLAAKAREHFHKISGDLSEEDVCNEYEIQLIEIGRILNLKIRWHRRAVSFLQLQLFAVAGSAVLGFAMWLFRL